MNSTQNKKIEQVKETTMIVGIDVGSEKHYFRAFNWRGIELTRKPETLGSDPLTIFINSQLLQ